LYYEYINQKYKGIHPGIILERLLNKKGFHSVLCYFYWEHPQTINAITKGRRKLNVALALKIEEKLSLEEGSLAFYKPILIFRNKKVKQNKRNSNLNL
jgi:hypothetical protein